MLIIWFLIFFNNFFHVLLYMSLHTAYKIYNWLELFYRKSLLYCEIHGVQNLDYILFQLLITKKNAVLFYKTSRSLQTCETNPTYSLFLMEYDGSQVFPPSCVDILPEIITLFFNNHIITAYQHIIAKT